MKLLKRIFKLATAELQELQQEILMEIQRRKETAAGGAAVQSPRLPVDDAASSRRTAAPENTASKFRRAA